MRALKILAEIIGLVVAGFALAVILLAWRLSSGPLEIDFLTSYVEHAISDQNADTEIGSLALRWDGFDRPAVVAARNIRVKLKDGTVIAVIPEISADLSAPALLRGVVAPLRLDLIRPHLRVTRTEQGDFSFGLGEASEGAAPAAPETPPSQDVVKNLLAALDATVGGDNNVLASLTRLTLVDGSVQIDDRKLGRRWVAPRASADLSRTATGVDGRASLDVAAAGGAARFTGEIHYLRDKGVGRAAIAFANVVPAALTQVSPVLAPLEAIESPIDGRADIDFDGRFQPVSGRFSVTSTNTRLKLWPLWTQPLGAARTALSGTVDLTKRRLVLDDFSIDFGGPKVSLAGQVDAIGDTVEAAMVVTVATMPVDLLESLWPPAIRGGGSRDWITANLRDGVIDRVETSLQIRAPIANPADAAVVTFDGVLAARDLTVTYLPGLPPITGVNAAARFDQSTFRIKTTGGEIDDVALEPSEVTITDLDLKDQTIDIDARIKGPVRAVMSVLDSPRFGYAKKVDLDPARMAGQVSARLHFGFLLLADLDFDQVSRFDVQADFNDLAVGAVKPGYDVTAATAKLAADKTGMTLAGTAQVNTVPVAFSWHEAFDGAAVGSRITVKATVDEAARAALHVPEVPMLGGTVGADLDLQARKGGVATLDAKLDLTDARISIDPIGWEKPPGSRAEAVASLSLASGRLAKVVQFSVSGGDIAASGSADFDRDGALSKLAIASLRQGRTDVKGEVAVLGPDSYRLALEGPRLDVSGLLGQRRAAGQPQGAATDPAPAPPSRPGMAIDASFDVGELVLGKDRSLTAVHGRAQGRTTSLQDITLSAQLPGGKPIDLRLTPEQTRSNRQLLTLRGEDAGEVLRVLDIADNITGGSLLAVGTRDGETGTIEGKVDARDFVMKDAPGMARLLAATSPSGLQDLFGTAGLTFNRLEADFTYAGLQRRLTLKQGRGAGGDLGLAFDGVLDLRAETVDLAGTIVPIYHINSVISAIPLIGDILTGGEGGGLFAFTYSIRGPFADPAVSVNPLSVLAPGFLRRLFFEETPSAADAPRPPRPPLAPPRER